MILCSLFIAAPAFSADTDMEDFSSNESPGYHLSPRAPTPTNLDLTFADFEPVQNFQQYAGISLADLNRAFEGLITTWNQEGFSPDTQEKLMSYGLQYYYDAGRSPQGPDALPEVATFVWALTNAATPAAHMGVVNFIYNSIIHLMPHCTAETHLWYAQHVFYPLYETFSVHPLILQAMRAQLKDLFSTANFETDRLPVFHCAEAIEYHYRTCLSTLQGQFNIHHAFGQVDDAIDAFHQWSGYHQITHPAEPMRGAFSQIACGSPKKSTFIFQMQNLCPSFTGALPAAPLIPSTLKF
ncbi:MAG: hypothetical protein H6925_04645 [Holosporaceae bacterium]|nr:MAG: hypothetical protein H6925_04645 [Holosporaceae bacterium]